MVNCIQWSCRIHFGKPYNFDKFPLPLQWSRQFIILLGWPQCRHQHTVAQTHQTLRQWFPLKAQKHDHPTWKYAGSGEVYINIKALETIQTNGSFDHECVRANFQAKTRDCWGNHGVCSAVDKGESNDIWTCCPLSRTEQVEVCQVRLTTQHNDARFSARSFPHAFHLLSRPSPPFCQNVLFDFVTSII